MVLRSETQAIPRTPDDVIGLFKKVMQLSGVVDIRVTAREFTVVREMPEDDDGPVVPKTSDVEIDIDYLLSRIVLEEPTFVSGEHPYILLADAMDRLVRSRLVVSGIIAPPAEALNNIFALREDVDYDHFMGVRVFKHNDEKYPDKIVVLGGPTPYAADASRGIIIDMGL